MVNVRKRLWGNVNSEAVYLFCLEDESGMSISVSNYGCILQSWQIQKQNKRIRDIVLGYESLREYINSNTYFGAAIGPISDRIANGHCRIGDKSIQFPVNAGPDCIHSGSNGFHSRIWDWEILRNGIAFSYCFSPEESPLPGRLKVIIRYFLKPSNTLHIEYEAICNKNTYFSMTNHSYFTLNGGVSHCRDQILTVHADCYAQTERETEPVCTGRTLPVQDTPFDLRSGRKIGDILENHFFSEIRSAGGLDHYFPIKGEGMREHARLYSKEDSLALLCNSDMPGLLVYTANGLETGRGKNGCIYGKNYAVCMETECFPNAVNFPNHRRQVFQPATERFRSCTEFQALLM